MDKSLTRKIITEGTVIVLNRIKIHSDHIKNTDKLEGGFRTVEDFSKFFRYYKQSYSIHIWDVCIRELAMKIHEELKHSQIEHPFNTMMSGYYALTAYSDNINRIYVMDDNNDMVLIMRTVLMYNEDLNRIEIKPIKNK